MRSLSLLRRPIRLAGLFVLFLAAVPGSGGSPDEGFGTMRAPFQREAEGSASADILPLWKEFAARTSGPLGVSWNRSGTPKSVFGQLSEPLASASETEARRFLADHASLFGMLETLDNLELVRSFESPAGRHFVFQQRYRGVPVFGAAVRVHFNDSGSVIAVNNTSVPGIDLDSVTPRIGAEGALTIARRAAGVGRHPDSPDPSEPAVELGISADGGVPTLAWEIELPTSGATWQVFVDAQSGALLAPPLDINRYATGTGQVFRVNAVVATHNNALTDDNDAASAVPGSAYSIVTLQGLAGTGYLEGAYASSDGTKRRAFSAGNTFVFDRSNDGFSETMGYYYLDYSQRYIQSLGFGNVNNRRQSFSVNRFKPDNSFYSPKTKDLTFGLGGVDDAEDADVIWHEYGHSIQDNQVPGFGTTLQAGSMGEGFGDYWAGSVGAQLSGGFQDLCLAEWDATSYSSSNPPCLRRLDSTKHYPESVAGEVHDDGEMWSASLWQIRSAIGAARADKVILQAHFLLTPGASFSDGSNALVTAARNLGYTNGEVNQIRNILRNRGFTVTA